MAKIELPARLKVADAVDAAILANNKGGHRPHLGASLIGDSCARRLWYTFRWADLQEHDARILRLFNRGHREEQQLVNWLRMAGVEVLDHDVSTGRQHKVSAVGDHFGGSLDAVAHGVHDAPKTWHVVEFKTHSQNSFAALFTNGVKQSKPQHWAQMMVYMHLTGIDRALYVAVNKNDDDLYFERVKLDKDEGERLLATAKRIIQADSPPERIGNGPAYYECKMCRFREVCYEMRAPMVNCRTCMNSTPVVVENMPTTSSEGGIWKCEKWKDQIALEYQEMGCKAHRFIPTFFKQAGTAVDVEDNGDVVYRTKDGKEWRNGDGKAAVDSHEMRAIPIHALVTLPLVCETKAVCPPGARIVGAKRAES